MKQPSKPMQLARRAIENHLTVLTIVAIVIGLGMRYIADPKEFSDSKDIIKEIGNFILITFVVGFIYENFVNYRYKHEFIHEIESILSSKFQLPISKVYSQRPTLDDKADLMKLAKYEIIEFGTALHTFTNYMDSNMSFHAQDGEVSRYRDLIESRLKDGVNVTCVLLDPSVATMLKELEPEFEEKVKTSLVYLEEFEASVSQKKYSGKFQIILYKALSHYSAIAIDATKDEGVILMSPYITGKRNSDIPAFKIEKRTSGDVFDNYWDGIKNTINTSTI
jgi:hypothetical protein